MKTTLKICGMDSSKDVNRIRIVISGNEGVVACGIHKSRKEAEIVFDDGLVSIDDIINSIEDAGYTIL